MRVKENQKTLISGRIGLYDLPENDILTGKFRVDHGNGESETVFQAGFTGNLVNRFLQKPPNLPEKTGGEN
jgi:hypothetical protein